MFMTVGRPHICKLSRHTNTKLVHPFRGKPPNVSTLQIKLFKEPVTIILIITPDCNTKRNKKAFIVYFTNLGTSNYIAVTSVRFALHSAATEG